MAKTRPGVDRITKQTMTTRATFTESQIERHIIGCSVCSSAKGDVRAMCATWWDTAKLVHRTRRQLRQYKQPELGNMDTLPGLEMQ